MKTDFMEIKLVATHIAFTEKLVWVTRLSQYACIFNIIDFFIYSSNLFQVD